MTRLLLVGASICLADAMQVNSRACLALALGLLLLSLLLPPSPTLQEAARNALRLFLGVGLGFHFALLLMTPPGMYLKPGSLVAFRLGVVVAAALALSLLRPSPPLRRLHVPLLLAVHFLLGVWMIRASPDPRIDVAYTHRESIAALFKGESPYSTTIPNIYGESARVFYAPGVVVDGRVQVGFPYPPLSLLAAIPGHVAGDYRYALLLAMTLTGALVAYARAGPFAAVAAALFLFMPRVFFVLEQGWTDPFVALALAAVVFCACRASRWLPVALGAFFAIKQYAVLAAPLVWLLVPAGGRVRMLSLAACVAALLTAPFVLWDPEGFTRSVVLFQLKQPFRPDSISLLPYLIKNAQSPLLWLPCFAALAGALALALRRAERTPAGFALGTALVFLAFFAFAKQAFAGYYFFVVGALSAAIASRE